MNLLHTVREAAGQGLLLPGAAHHLTLWLEAGFLPAWALSALEELAAGGHWEELNNRFYKTIAFGTGGMRDRTIAARPAQSELGQPTALGTPAHAAVGTALLNDFNIIRATLGLYRYCDRYLRETLGRPEQPRLVIAHDARHFSRHFCELSASTWVRQGGWAMIFEGPRSTPQLSFSVRHLGATAGVVITASHNPPTDNGFKAYFADGAQVVSPHAEGIIAEVNAVALADVGRFLEKEMSRVTVLPTSLDEAYQAALDENILAPEAFRKHPVKVVFTPIHGVGALASAPALRRYGVEVVAVDSQWVMDPRFPTVKSPNPENPEALAMALEKARACQADAVLATDPDCDRLGVAAPDRAGNWQLFSGNQTGSMLLEYRLTRHKELGLLPASGSERAAVIKTFVTTPLQEAIARAHGVKIVDTLTGFKYIGEKMLDYEKELAAALRQKEGLALDYDRTSPETRRRLLLEHSTYYIFGGEESYGYLASDRVRDKDGNAAVLLFTELVADLKSRGMTVGEYLDRLYLRYGYYTEGILNIYYEGAAGAARIARILSTYRSHPPAQLGDWRVERFDDYGTQAFFDADGKEIPRQDLYFLHLDNGYSYAVRGSGTEPKIKFYLFAREEVPEPAALDEARARAGRQVDALKSAIETDARRRAGE